MKNRYKNPLFIGSMFTGIGLGFIFDNVAAGVFLGIGLGFILSYIFK